MSAIRRGLGSVVSVLAWPLLWLYLLGSNRSRVLVVSDSKVLVAKGWLGIKRQWSLPGGGIHKNETPLQGAVRELSEETGLKVSPKQLISLNSEPYRYRSYRFHCHYFLLYLEQPSSLTPSWEILTLAWMSEAELKSDNPQPDVLRALELWKGSRSFVTMKPGSN